MPGQINYYNQFGNLYQQSIFDCPEPQYWTTDYCEKGRVYWEMKERIDIQEKLIDEYFSKKQPVLDIGCGFGRQAISLAKKGYSVRGTDTSEVFVEIAKQLFTRHGYPADFKCMDIIKEDVAGHFNQILLLDVLEHIKPTRRRALFEKLHKISARGGAVLIVSLPHVKKRVSSQLNNRIRRRITQHISFFLNREEHPYPIPVKKDIVKLVKGVFKIIEMLESSETDYYILNRL